MAVSKKAYVMTADGCAVLDDGKQSGAILVGKGGTIDDALAAEYGVEVYAPGEYAALCQSVEDQRVRDLEAARLAPLGTSLAAAASAPPTADRAAVDGAKQAAKGDTGAVAAPGAG